MRENDLLGGIGLTLLACVLLVLLAHVLILS